MTLKDGEGSSEGLQIKRIERVENGFEGSQTRGSRQSRLAWMGDGGGSEEEV